ncbi:uncharacterized protein H6S33_000112 [Morchella sextelata]|uniref:uncharacterized protein n=1 Tax=Morchella sextelata TaxID=1174677 RepID=UPI001D057600|nr:uncharacterized protein H6S33_000112 [Morchella sextelata]KAH0614476.1 hypothetical protein H6S33_000112 [Morchella sextelata]
MPPKGSSQKPRPQKSAKQQKQDQRRSVSPSKVPSNWPSEILYLYRPKLSRSLPASTISQLSLSPTSPTSISRPSPLVKIKKIDAPTHPANGQFGLFAASNLPAKSFILDYLGYVHDSTDTNEKSDYDLCLDRELGVGVDAQNVGNEARMVNDYRGVPGFERPNVVFETRRVGGGENGELRMALWVGSKDIKKGVELCVSYGKGFWQGRMKEEESAENKIDKE